MSSPSSKLENAASAAPLSSTASALPDVATHHGQPEPEPGSEPARHVLHPATVSEVLDEGVGVEGDVATETTDTAAAFVLPVYDSLAGSLPVPVSLPAHPAAHVLPSVVPDTPESNHAVTTPSIPSAVDQDSNKKSRPPMTTLRSSGPSLLTQALASARGILASSPNPLQTEHRRPEQKSTPSFGAVAGNVLKAYLDTRTGELGDDPQNEIASRVEGAPLMSRVRSYDSVTAPTTITTTTSSSSTFPILTDSVENPSSSLLDMPGRTVEKARPNGHRDVLSGTKERPRSLERTEKEIRTNQIDVSNSGSANVGDTSSPHAEVAGEQNNTIQDKDNSDARVQYRTWRADRTLSLGPEKAWSIGKGDLAGAEPGQVEKSITEALAGVEPTRSRKASHSLRFFKEGLPNEKGKRKDAKRKEDLITQKEQIEGSQKHGTDVQQVASPSPSYFQDIIGIPTDSVYPSAGSAVESPLDDSQANDYFGIQPQANDDSSTRQLSPILEQRHSKPADTASASSSSAVQSNCLQREFEDRTVTADTAEEGDDSSEEKISSAFFVPHQEAPELVKPDNHFGRPLPVHRQSVVKDVSPWLVKADEPEFEHRSLDQVPNDQSVSVAPGNGRQVGDDFAVEEDVLPLERSQTVPGSLSRPVSQCYDEQVHDHQFGPKSPLEAIELIPYKHQVGGHTTLWRFSKRAVCKQLNNSENKFYENIERYHRDLLPFLPRYVSPSFYLSSYLFSLFSGSRN